MLLAFAAEKSLCVILMRTLLQRSIYKDGKIESGSHCLLSSRIALRSEP